MQLYHKNETRLLTSFLLIAKHQIIFAGKIRHFVKTFKTNYCNDVLFIETLLFVK